MRAPMNDPISQAQKEAAAEDDSGNQFFKVNIQKESVAEEDAAEATGPSDVAPGPATDSAEAATADAPAGQDGADAAAPVGDDDAVALEHNDNGGDA